MTTSTSMISTLLAHLSAARLPPLSPLAAGGDTAGSRPAVAEPALPLSYAHRNPRKVVSVRRTRRPRRMRITALATLAMLNLFTLAAGVAVARMLPPRLAALRIPVAAARPVLRPGTVLPPVAAGTAGSGSGADPGSLPTAAGLAAMLGSTLPAGETGPQVGVEVADARTGEVLYAENGSTLATP